MSEITIEIDPRDYMSEQQWGELRRESWNDLLEGKLPLTRTFLDDLIRCHEAIERNQKASALHYLERAIKEVGSQI